MVARDCAPGDMLVCQRRAWERSVPVVGCRAPRHQKQQGPANKKGLPFSSPWLCGSPSWTHTEPSALRLTPSFWMPTEATTASPTARKSSRSWGASLRLTACSISVTSWSSSSGCWGCERPGAYPRTPMIVRLNNGRARNRGSVSAAPVCLASLRNHNHWAFCRRLAGHRVSVYLFK